MDKTIQTWSKTIYSKVNVIARLQFELTYYAVVVKYVYHNATKTPPFFAKETTMTRKRNKAVNEVVKYKEKRKGKKRE